MNVLMGAGKMEANGWWWWRFRQKAPKKAAKRFPIYL